MAIAMGGLGAMSAASSERSALMAAGFMAEEESWRSKYEGYTQGEPAEEYHCYFCMALIPHEHHRSDCETLRRL